jgi:nucleotide-binding universal stress UspA family protein
MATVVIGYVPTPEGEAALATGIAEARLRDASLVVVHRPRNAASAAAETTEVTATLAGSGVAHEVRPLTEGLELAESLVTAAHDSAAALVVIGLRRRTPTGKLILGTSAQAVLLDAPCPVLTVKP